MFPYNPPQLPTNNRLTQPIGTPLPNPFSNPSAATNGAQGANSGGLNVPQIGTPSVGGGVGGSTFGQWLKSIFTPVSQTLANPNWTPPPAPKLPTAVTNPRGTFGQPNPAFDKGENVPKPTGAINPPSSVSASPLVGASLDSNPNALSAESVASLFPGRSAEEIANVMASKGYTLQLGRPGFTGSQWVLTNPQQPAQGVSNMGNNFYGDPTALARGERVTVNPGYHIVGGTPTTKDQGNTPAGTGQYAVTVGTVNQKRDARGDYKWTSYTTKDSNGNWVRVYRKVLRGGVTRQGARQQAAIRADENRGTGKNSQQVQPDQNTNQLVTLRANFG